MGNETKCERPTRREVLLGAGAWSLMQAGAVSAFAEQATAMQPESTAEKTATPKLPHARPAVADRKFTSPAVEDAVATLQGKIGDPNLRVIFANCFPNTLDTTVWPGSFAGKPDTYVVTGDIDAMWLRDSWPALAVSPPEARRQASRTGGRRHSPPGTDDSTDPYANAFTRNPTDKALSWAVHDQRSTHWRSRAQVGDRLALLSHPSRLRVLAGYWRC